MLKCSYKMDLVHTLYLGESQLAVPEEAPGLSSNATDPLTLAESTSQLSTAPTTTSSDVVLHVPTAGGCDSVQMPVSWRDALTTQKKLILFKMCI